MRYVFIDTSVLRGMRLNDGPLAELIDLGKAGHVKIFWSKFALDEWASGQVESFSREGGRALGYLNKAYRNHCISDQHRQYIDRFSLPDNADLKRSARRLCDRVMKLDCVEIIPEKFEHFMAVRNAYLNREPPFDKASEREASRKDIPDAWILEALKEAASSAESDIFCVVTDGNFSKVAGRVEGVSVVCSISEAVKLIVRGVAEQASAEPAAHKEKIQPKEVVKAVLSRVTDPIDEYLSKVNTQARPLEVLVLGLVSGLDGPSHADLFDVLRGQGFSEEEIRLTTRRHELAGAILNTGHNFIPKNIELCDIAVKSKEVIVLLVKVASGDDG